MPIPRWLEDWQERELARLGRMSDEQIRQELISEYGSEELVAKSLDMMRARITEALCRYWKT